MHGWRVIGAAVLGVFLAGCAGDGRHTADEAPVVEERADLAALFEERGVVGTFAMYDPRAGRMVVVDAERARRRYAPASTFKIPNSLIAFETGAVRDEHEVVPYGGGEQFLDAWERDMTLPEAIRVSNVPVYQEVARRIGLERMQRYVDRLDYGNRELGEVVDRFWLDGPLAISAVEQTRFLARLAQGRLPLSARSQSLVREMLRSPDDPDLYAKTGWLMSSDPDVGWWVGWVERDGGVYAFALNIDVIEDSDAAQRIPLGKALLAALGL